MKKRLISAIIALIIIVPLLILGGIYFKTLLSILSVLAIKEVLELKNNLPKYIKYISYVLVFLLMIFDISNIIKIFIIILIYFTLLVFVDKDKYNINDCTYIVGFMTFLILVFSYINIVRNGDINVLIYLLLITILTDSFAYFGGKLFGRHKLIERISPNKTIEGSISGTIMGTVFPSMLLIISMTFILSIVGQIGDLIFSSIKRYYKIKDFSNIMPGHGGILDRLDSIIFVIIGYIILLNFL